jgi:hypothetical protein
VDDPLRDRALAGLFTKWIEDQRDWLLALGFGRRKTATALPAQATIYRFIWALEQQVVALEKALQLWATDVLHALAGGLLEVSLDGQHLKGSARGGVGDKAIVLVSAYLSRSGLSLSQSKAAGDEAAAGRGLMMEVGADLAEAKIPWVLTGDAAHTEAQTAQAVLQKGGTTSSISRTIRPS